MGTKNSHSRLRVGALMIGNVVEGGFWFSLRDPEDGLYPWSPTSLYDEPAKQPGVSRNRFRADATV
jgi:hypothetical protein